MMNIREKMDSSTKISLHQLSAKAYVSVLREKLHPTLQKAIQEMRFRIKRRHEIAGEDTYDQLEEFSLEMEAQKRMFVEKHGPPKAFGYFWLTIEEKRFRVENFSPDQLDKALKISFFSWLKKNETGQYNEGFVEELLREMNKDEGREGKYFVSKFCKTYHKGCTTINYRRAESCSHFSHLIADRRLDRIRGYESDEEGDLQFMINRERNKNVDEYNLKQESQNFVSNQPNKL